MGLVRRTVVVEPNGDELLAMDDRGDVRAFAKPADVLAWVLRRDRAAQRRGRSTVTAVEWRGMPDGFVPPEVPQ